MRRLGSHRSEGREDILTWTFSTARRVEAAPEGDAPRGSEGLTGCATYNERTRDRMQAAEAMKLEVRPRTDAELAADAGLAEYNRRQQAKAREEQERLNKIARRRQQEADEKAAAELKQKRAVIAFQEAAVLHEASDLTADEAQIFWDKLAGMDKMLDAGVAAIVAEEIRSRKV